jgi:hypothetical protein
VRHGGEAGGTPSLVVPAVPGLFVRLFASIRADTVSAAVDAEAEDGSTPPTFGTSKGAASRALGRRVEPSPLEPGSASEEGKEEDARRPGWGAVVLSSEALCAALAGTGSGSASERTERIRAAAVGILWPLVHLFEAIAMVAIKELGVPLPECEGFVPYACRPTACNRAGGLDEGLRRLQAYGPLVAEVLKARVNIHRSELSRATDGSSVARIWHGEQVHFLTLLMGAIGTASH